MNDTREPEEGLAARTIEAYDQQRRQFEQWCVRSHLPPTSASAGLYLVEKAPDRSVAWVNQARAALNAAFGFDEEPCTCWRCARHEARVLAQPAGPRRVRMSDDEVRLVLEIIDSGRRVDPKDEVAGARDACMITLIRSANLRRSDLIALDADDVHIGTGMTLEMKIGQGVRVTKHRLPVFDPIARLAEWTLFVDTGPLFRKVERNGAISSNRWHPSSVDNALKRRCAAAGLGPSKSSAESFRPPRRRA